MTFTVHLGEQTVLPTKIGKGLAQDRERFWGPSSPNPWTNPLFMGPANRRPIDGDSHRRGRAERRQQRTAMNKWEDEGGSLAAPIAKDGEP